MGGRKWICAEKLDSNVYAMQSEGITTGWHPGVYYIRSYCDISSKYDALKTFYEEWSPVEAGGGRINDTSYNAVESNRAGEWESGSDVEKDGLYLISKTKASNSTYYTIALKSAVRNRLDFGIINDSNTATCAWLGSHGEWANMA